MSCRTSIPNELEIRFTWIGKNWSKSLPIRILRSIRCIKTKQKKTASANTGGCCLLHLLEDELVDFLTGSLVHLRYCMRVYVQSHRNISVAKPFLHNLWTHAGLQHNRGVAVTQSMKLDMLKTSAFQKPFPFFRPCIRSKRLSIRLTHHKTGVIEIAGIEVSFWVCVGLTLIWTRRH